MATTQSRPKPAGYESPPETTDEDDAILDQLCDEEGRHKREERAKAKSDRKHVNK